VGGSRRVLWAVALASAVCLPMSGTPATAAPACTISGTSGSNVLVGTSGNDVICGKGGIDKIFGQGGDDRIYGGSGSDTLEGGSGSDTIHGQGGNDRIWGDGETNSLFGEAGSDQIVAKGNNDFVYGGIGNDKCLSVKDTGSGDHLDGGPGTDHYLKDAFDLAVNAEVMGCTPPPEPPVP
jgi:Ca2+-binding RTX toxin-like protein